MEITHNGNIFHTCSVDVFFGRVEFARFDSVPNYWGTEKMISYKCPRCKQEYVPTTGTDHVNCPAGDGKDMAIIASILIVIMLIAAIMYFTIGGPR